MTDDSWFGITPEPVALYVHKKNPLLKTSFNVFSAIAQHVSTAAPSTKTILIDAFGGAGGNAIAFALSGRWEQIFYIEKDPQVLKCAKHNAEIYGVSKRIHFRLGDSFDEIPKRFTKKHGQKAVLFASPPWGGELIDFLNS
jgi:trimethylguanosine synthase